MLTNIIPMNPEVKQEWVQELRSQKYKQGNFVMRRSTSGGLEYCCLGVLSDIYAKLFGLEWVDSEGIDGFTLEGTTARAYLADEVRTWAKLEAPLEGQLSHLNDSNYSFLEIADIIEQEL